MIGLRSQRFWILCVVLIGLTALAGSASAQFLIDGDVDGSVGPTVPINQPPPRPINDPLLLIGEPGFLIVNTDNLNLRSGPGPEYSQIAVLDGGTRLIALGTNGDFRRLWWYVEVGGLRGWVTNEFVIIRGDLRGLPVVPVRGELARPTLYIGVRNTLYSAPSPYSDPICDVGGDLFYYVLGADARAASWYLIEAECFGAAVTGWIQADRGLLRNPAGVALPILQG
ncbi:MAG: SH3 domain-containing protein [Anaerolinea sp.]|nr:SH3 domain-containing protein [Anaerolinea sp.]